MFQSPPLAQHEALVFLLKIALWAVILVILIPAQMTEKSPLWLPSISHIICQGCSQHLINIH